MNTNKLMSIFFLILMINGIFASSIDPTRIDTKNTLNFADAAVPNQYTSSPNLSSCYTEELSPEAVERIWNDILVKGFTVDTLTSNQPADITRETLEKSDVIVTSQDTKKDDVVGKTTMPNQVINPLEIPTVLGQVCYGPFSQGLNLDKTLRVGRCEGDVNSACYLQNEGLFRQNGRYGFFDQTYSIGKDILDMIGVKKLNQIGNEIIDPTLDYNSNVDLGLFTDMSYEELAEFRSSQFTNNDLTEIQITRLNLILDDAIQNSIITNSFNASMESTCNSDNCYINMYSLFDKVFNQYYSADLVFTSISPMLWKFTSKIFNKIPLPKKLITENKNGFNSIRGKNGFLDNLLNKNMNPVQSALSSYKLNKITKNMDVYIDGLAKSNKTITKTINRYNLKPEFDKYLEALNSKKNIDTIKNEFFQTGTFAKLNKAKQRVFMQSVMEYEGNIKAVRTIHDITSSNIDTILTGSNARKILMDKTKTMDDFYGSLTKEQYDNVQIEVLRSNKLNKEFSGYTNNKFKWKDGAEDITLLKERGKIIAGEDELMNKVRMKNEVNPIELTNSSKFGDLIEKGNGGIGAYETQNVIVNFADGPQTIKMIVPYKETVGAVNPVNYANIANYNSADILIDYTSKKGITKQVRGSLLDISDVDPGLGITAKSVSEKAVIAADMSKYGIDPLEVSLGYMDKLGMKKIKDAEKVTEGVTKVLTDQGWATGRGLNYINQRMKQQHITEWSKKPFNMISNSAKAYLYNFAYWQFKTAGTTLGGALDKYSMFRVPETYTSIIFKHGTSGEIYNDSYIDFFVNDGSDQGDLFMKYFNSLIFWMVNIPKEALENTEWETTQGVSNWMTNITEGHIRRSFTNDIAIFTDSFNNGCNTASCQIKLGDSTLLENTTRKKSVDSNISQNTEINSKLDISYLTGNSIKTTSYLLENTSEENMDDYGQTLIAFSHHTDYDGSMGGSTTQDSVNLLAAQKQEDTCSAKLRNLEVMGVPIGWTNTWTDKSYRAGLVAAGFSNIAYYALSAPQHGIMLGAVFGDVIPQVTIVPQIYNCVDDEEGYYTHFFVAKEEFERIEKDPKNKIGDVISKGADSVQKTLTNVTKNTELQNSITKTTEEVKNFAETKIKDNPIMQSRIETQGDTSASLKGKLFFFELGASSTCRASGYNDKGVEQLIDSKLGETLVIDKEEGTISIVDKDGNIKEIIGVENKDWVRLIATNLGIPAKVIPHSLSYIPVPDTNTPLFNMDVFGNLKIEDIDFLNCLKSNYFEQTGLEMTGNTLTDYLGSVKQITTTNTINPNSQYDAIPKGRQGTNEIVVEGTPRKIANGENARVTVLGNRITKVYPIEGQDVTLGKNIAIQFERGQLIYNGEKNSYIMWVEQTYVMHQSEIKGMDITPIKETNPVTGCEENAFEMAVNPDASNPEAIAKSTEMNKALQKVGPFQMFETASKTFIFYTTDAPECQNRMKIIDKKTGVVTDQAIDGIIATPDGFIVTTEDGQQHNFAFSAEDGVPKLKYNDQIETLLSAQGKNGAFWYDPKTGNWTTENGHMIPFNPEYRDGVTFKVGEDGKTYGTTIQNLMNPFSGTGSDSGGSFNIPLTPEKFLPFVLYVLAIMGSFMYLFNRKEEFFKRKK